MFGSVEQILRKIYYADVFMMRYSRKQLRYVIVCFMQKIIQNQQGSLCTIKKAYIRYTFVQLYVMWCYSVIH